jgi:hypothetical protein
MINVRASVSLAGAAYQSGVAGRTHAHRGLCARPLGTAVLQDVHEGWCTCSLRCAVKHNGRTGGKLRRDPISENGISFLTFCTGNLAHKWPLNRLF